VAELQVIVTPRAARDAIEAGHDGALRVRVTRPPAGGEANRSVIRLVATALDVPPSSISIASGQRARHKRLVLASLDEAELRRRLAAIGHD
jgi:uncharacterized protein YggU (UPF0235/DUF167 family)